MLCNGVLQTAYLFQDRNLAYEIQLDFQYEFVFTFVVYFIFIFKDTITHSEFKSKL